MNAVDGVATFTGLSLNRAGSGYTLAAASPGLPGATSTAFDVTPGTPAALSFSVQPGNAVAGGAIPAFQVEVRDAFGNLVTNVSTQVTLSLGNNPGGATLGGTTPSNNRRRRNIRCGDAGPVGVGLHARGELGGAGRESAAFDVTPGPAAQPAVLRGTSHCSSLQETLSPPIQVEVLDARGNRVTKSSATVVSLQDRQRIAEPLAGTKTRTAANGVATFR